MRSLAGQVIRGSFIQVATIRTPLLAGYAYRAATSECFLRPIW